MYPYQINTLYNFETYAPAILGLGFKNVTILGIMNSVTAANYINVATSNANILPYLPAGTPRDYNKHTYLLIMTESGIKTVISAEWINPSSVELVTSTSLTITVAKVSTSDVSRIREALTLLGFNYFNIVVN